MKRFLAAPILALAASASAQPPIDLAKARVVDLTHAFDDKTITGPPRRRRSS